MNVGAVRLADGATLGELTAARPAFLLFLRHQGCTFAREALADLRAQRERLEQLGVTPVLVHLDADEVVARAAEDAGVGDLPRIEDPAAEVFAMLGMKRAGVFRLLGPHVLFRWTQCAIGAGHGFGLATADVRRLGGIALVRGGAVIAVHAYETPADRADFASFVASALFNPD
jgi:hypothetical protein